jgi:hypothetical protein
MFELFEPYFLDATGCDAASNVVDAAFDAYTAANDDCSDADALLIANDAAAFVAVDIATPMQKR